MFHYGIKLSCIVMAIGSCNTGTLFPVSDVPCFQPTSWSIDGGGGTLIRTIPDVEGAILITFQTSAQIQQDFSDGDGMLTFFPHERVYRFFLETGIFEPVDNSVWDNLTTPARVCSLSVGDTSPFGSAGVSRPSLLFEGEEIPVAGGAFLTIEGAPESAVVAVESTDGSFSAFLPFTPGNSNGQHFHQLFSRLDGSPVGEAVRIGIVGRANLCWTLDEKYVIYGGLNSNEESTICIVPIEDELPQFGN